MRHGACVKVREQREELAIAYNCVSAKGQIRANRLGDKRFHPKSHLASPCFLLYLCKSGSERCTILTSNRTAQGNVSLQ